MNYSTLKTRVFVLIILVFALAAVAQNVKGPVARYSFNDGTAEDEIGDNDAKAYNLTLTDDRFGNSNSALFFHGNTDSYLSLGTSSILKPKIGSISVWVRIHMPIYKGVGAANNDIIYTRASVGPDFNEGYVIGYNYEIKKINGAISCSEDRQVILYPERPTYLRVWHHVVLTYDERYTCFYMDGVLEAKAVKNFEACFLEGDSVIVGCHNEKKNSRTFLGDIDDIEIYDKVLSPSEVLILYNAPNPNKTVIIIKWVLAGLFIVICLILISWWVRLRVKRAVSTEKEKNRLNNRILELETRAIRTQMNPHFVFNSLNTLQRFILEDDKRKSYKYLIEFSRLLRKVLESSESDTISLKEEMEILIAYLDIEKMRFGNSFEYKVTSEFEHPQFVFIPIMFIQPFAENAIWHGLLNKQGQRLLSISFKSLDEKRILCEIDDNGVGRNYKTKKTSAIKKKSLAIDFTRQRLELARQSTGVECSLNIIDKVDVDGHSLGTTVKIILPKS